MLLSHIPISESKAFIQIACLEQSEIAIYSASMEESATVFWACDRQEMTPPANLKKKPVTNRRLILSAENPCKHIILYLIYSDRLIYNLESLLNSGTREALLYS